MSNETTLRPTSTRERLLGMWKASNDLPAEFGAVPATERSRSKSALRMVLLHLFTLVYTVITVLATVSMVNLVGILGYLFPLSTLGFYMFIITAMKKKL